MALRADPYQAKPRTPGELLRFLVERAQAKQRAGRPGTVTIDLSDVLRVLEVVEAAEQLIVASDARDADGETLTHTGDGMLPMSHDVERALGSIRSAVESRDAAVVSAS